MKTKLITLFFALMAVMAINATDYYFAGTANGWSNNNDAWKFTKVNGVLTLEVADLYGEFKIAENGAWHPQHGAAAEGEGVALNGSYNLVKCDDSQGEADAPANARILFPQEGDWRYKHAKLTLDATDPDHLVISFVAGTLYDHSVAPKTYQIVGAFNDWNAIGAPSFEEINGVLTVTVADLSGTFKIIQDHAWDNQWATNWETGAGLALGEPYILGAKGDQGEPANLSLANPFGGYKDAVLTLTKSGDDFVLTLVSGTFNKMQADWFLPGAWQGWKCDDVAKMSPVQGADNTYELLLAKFSGEFKVVYGQWALEFGGRKGEDERWKLNRQMELTFMGENMKPEDPYAVYQDVTITLVVDYNKPSVLLTVSSDSRILVDDLYYNFNKTEKTAEVTYELQYGGDNYKGLTTANIPASVTYSGTTYSVTNIGDGAFHDCSSLTSVTIPNSVTSIGSNAFYGCRSLTSVSIPNSVTSIGDGAFGYINNIIYSGTATGSPWGAKCVNGYVDGYLVYSDDTKTTLLGCYAAATGTIVIPNSVTSIGNYAFNLCSSLTSVTIPNGVTSIGGGAFYGCSSLTSVTIPNSVTSIGSEAFDGCSGLTSVSIPNSVTSIGDDAFSGCSSLPVVDNLRYADTYLVKAVDKTLSSYTIRNGTKWIGDAAFFDCYKLTSVTIPNSVTSIGKCAFFDCSSLTSIEIPNSVTSIGNWAFEGCSSLTKVNITDIAAWCHIAFGDYEANPLYNAKHLFVNDVEVTDLVIPNSVTSIGNSAFYNCSSLTSVTIGNGVTSIGLEAFDGCSSLTSVTIGNSVTSIGERAFVWCESLTSVTIPNSVTSIGSEAFEGCSSLTSVSIPNSVTSIGDGAFDKCSSLPVINNLRYADTYLVEAVDKTLSSYTIRNGTKWIGDYAFSKCSSLTSVTIPNSVTSIGKGAFSGCTGLTSVTIPNSVTSIGDWAFEGCSSLTAIYVPCGEMERFKQMLNNDSRIIDHAPLPYTITINAINGTVAYPQTTCDDMQLTATPYNGYHFVKWSDGNTDNPRTIELTRDTTFTALFASNQCTVSLQCDENQGTVEGAGVFDYLAEVQISATPAYGYHFSSWSDGNTDNPRTITITKDIALTANFALNKYALNVSCNAEQGSVTGSGSYNYLSNRTIEAIPNYGYHFTQWSDGNTDNPRTIELRQDTTLEAIFAVDKYGTCGDNLQLTWRYDTGSQTLTISGDGDLTANMRYGVEAVKEMKELVIEDGVGVIGNEAFANIKTLNTITLGKDVRKLQERVFYNCYNLTAIYNYRKTPASATSNTFEEVDKYACTIYVLAGSEEMFRSATGWKDFYSILAIGATETTVSDNKVSVEPSDNSATVTWPVSNEAASYTIDITKDGVVFCRLTFNANGQLTGIAFAPGRDGQSMAPAAVMTANGLQFTVTGLTSNTQYGYSITATDAENTEVASYTGTFTTTGEIATGIDAQQSDLAPRKFIRDNQVLILRDGKTYSIQGVEVK